METTRLFDFLYYQKEKYPLKKSLGSRFEGNFSYYSTDELIDKVNAVSRGLLKLGVRKGDKIALIAYRNRPEWVIMDIGIQQIGGISIPIYPTISSKEYQYIFNEAEVSYVFLGGGDLYDKVLEVKEFLPGLKEIYSFDKIADVKYWEELFIEDGNEELVALKESINEEDLATIIYTSGTTGLPKGVMLTHKNIVSNVKMVQTMLPCDSGDRVLSFLPLCHVFERTATFAYLYLGYEVTYVPTTNLGGDDGDLRAVKPHYFNTVPRLLEKVYEKIYDKASELSFLQQKVFHWAMRQTKSYDYGKPLNWRLKLANRLVFEKWRAAMGGHIKGIATGAAPCPEYIIRTFSAAGIPIREVYGLTETSPGLTVNSYKENEAMIGTVGKVLPGVEIYIDDASDLYGPGEGEILARGPNIMLGYYKHPEKTESVFRTVNDKKYFCTGDIGRFVTGPLDKSFLKITDRKKELLKTSGGKYVAPAPIESKLKEDLLVEQVMIVGDQKKFVSALIVPSIEGLERWCKNENIRWTTLEEAIQNKKVISRYQATIDKYNPHFSRTEQIKKFRILPVTWDITKPDGSPGELTPTLKIKRKVIKETYSKYIEDMYA